VKKDYEKPKAKSMQIEDPMAYACTVNNASASQGSWVGSGLSSTPIFNC